MKKMITAIMTMMVMVFLNGTTVFAAPETAKVVVIDGVYVTFDSAYYAEANPDVVAVVGTDEAALLQHFISAGRYEGRMPSAPYTQAGTAKFLKKDIYRSEYVSMPKIPVKIVTHAADGSIISTKNVAEEVIAQYEFDQYGNIVVEHVGSTFTMYYDGLGNCVKQEDHLFSNRPDITYDNIYDSECRLIQTIQHEGLDHQSIYITDYIYDGQGRLKEVHSGYKGKGQDFHEYYYYDEAGRVIDDVQKIFLEALPFPGYDQDAQVKSRCPYEYDALGRIVKVGRAGYTYDEEGNVKTWRIVEPQEGEPRADQWIEYIY